LKGATIRRAAKAAGSNAAAVEGWLRALRNGGPAAFFAAPPKYAVPGIDPVKFLDECADVAETDKLRAQIRSALGGRVGWRLKNRLMAVDRVLAGEQRSEVAQDMSIFTATLGKWIAAVRNEGLAKMVSRNDGRARRNDGELDAEQLRALARAEASPRVARRLLALAYVADGLGIEDAAIRMSVCGGSLLDWILRFRQGGVEALRNRELGPVAERRKLKAYIHHHAAVGYEELCKKIQARFGVRFSRVYVRRITRKATGQSQRV
jgi:transposase